MTNPVAPIEGHYALLRGDAVVGPIRNASVWHANSTDKWGCWYTDFLWDDAGYKAGKPSDPDLDIIATISPADMQAAASGEIERLRAEVAELRGLAWIAFHEFNAINARSGGPLDQYGMVTVTHEYWQAITDLFAKAAGETTPWPTDNAKTILERIKDQSHG